MSNKKIALVAILSLLSLSTSSVAFAERREVQPEVAYVHAPILHVTRDAGPRTTTQTNNLVYRGGKVMTNSVAVTPIYWGNSWATDTSDKNAAMASLYAGYNNSNHAGISTQYYQVLNNATTYVTKSVSVNPSVRLDSTASSQTSAVFNAVVAAIPFNSLSPDGYYPVYTDLKRGNAGYCAWHSYGDVTVSGVTKRIKFAFFFNLDGDSGCTPSASSGSYSQGAQSLANVSIHEIAEAMTDPELNAWYDKQGYENADKCAWKMNTVTLTGGKTWSLQGEWDNSTGTCKW